MADDGGWPRGGGPESWESGDTRTRVALDQLRVALDQAEGRLASGGASSAQPETLAALIQALDGLASRVAAHVATAERLATDRAAALERITERLEAQTEAQAAREAAMSARLDLMLEQLDRTRAEAEARRSRKDPAPIRMVTGAASAIAALSVVGAGALLLAEPTLLQRGLEHLGLRLGLKPAGAAAEVKAVAAPVPPRPQDTYAAVAAAFAGGSADALPRLTSLAEAGNAEAQLHLASLYETGEGGLPQDLPAARHWTERAARGGERVAQHNLALFLMQGEGGARDFSAAAFWFRKAGEQGVVDSQYNLGLLYEAGRGVEKNLSEAHRWFALAASAGDTAAREKQVEVAQQLQGSGSPAPGRPIRGDELATLVIAPATTIAETQALLARHGYYGGPVDGVATPAFRTAADAYLRDRGIAH